MFVSYSEVDSQLDADLEQKYEEKRQKGRYEENASPLDVLSNILEESELDWTCIIREHGC